MVDAWGGEDLSQELLVALNGTADRHRVSVAAVAIRYVIEHPTVAGVIVGVRLGISEHREDNANVFGFKLGSEDPEEIELVSNRSRDLYQAIGDCGGEYRA